MPKVPYANRRNKAYRALLVTVVRCCELPNATSDSQCAEYGVVVNQVENYHHDLDWRQLKYTLDCLVRVGLAFKTRGRRGILCKYWPVGGLQMIKAREARGVTK
jgi:hypothetical protein